MNNFETAAEVGEGRRERRGTHPLAGRLETNIGSNSLSEFMIHVISLRSALAKAKSSPTVSPAPRFRPKHRILQRFLNTAPPPYKGKPIINGSW